MAWLTRRFGLSVDSLVSAEVVVIDRRVPRAAEDEHTALRSVLGSAVRVLDAFHVVRLGFAAVDQVRCCIQREQTGHRGCTGDPLYRIRRLLRRAADHHTERSWTRLLAGLAAGDTR